MQTKEYSITKGFYKGLVSFFLFAIPMFLQVTPDQYLNLTIGGLAVMALNALKFYAKENFNI